MKKLNLKIKERMGLANLLDAVYKVGGLDLKTLLMVKKITERLLPGEKEAKKIGFKSIGEGKMTWDLKKDKGTEIEFSDDHIKILQEIIKRKDERKEFTIQDMFLVEIAKQLDFDIEID